MDYIRFSTVRNRLKYDTGNWSLKIVAHSISSNTPSTHFYDPFDDERLKEWIGKCAPLHIHGRNCKCHLTINFCRRFKHTHNRRHRIYYIFLLCLLSIQTNAAITTVYSSCALSCMSLHWNIFLVSKLRSIASATSISNNNNNNKNQSQTVDCCWRWDVSTHARCRRWYRLTRFLP